MYCTAMWEMHTDITIGMDLACAVYVLYVTTIL